jgi:hypothetical protein
MTEKKPSRRTRIRQKKKETRGEYLKRFRAEAKRRLAGTPALDDKYTDGRNINDANYTRSRLPTMFETPKPPVYRGAQRPDGSTPTKPSYGARRTRSRRRNAQARISRRRNR